MKTSAKWGVLVVLATAGFVGFACGGGEENPPPAVPSAPASEEAAPPASASASASAAASASAEPVASTPPAPPAPPPLVVVAMKLAGPKVKAEVKEDGSVALNGKPMGKFTGAELQDATGKVLASVATDGTITMEGATKTMKFDDKDTVEVEGGAKVMVGDDGVVKMLKADGKADKESGKFKFTGFKPTARRAATLLVIEATLPKPKPAAAPKPAAKPKKK